MIYVLAEFVRLAKLDPKADVRNRGTVCVPSSRAKDRKDHFPINSVAQARNALARVEQYDDVPDWYKGTLEELKRLVKRKVHAKYPSIDKKKAGRFDALIERLTKAAQASEPSAYWNREEQDGANAARFMRPNGENTFVNGPRISYPGLSDAEVGANKPEAKPASNVGFGDAKWRQAVSMLQEFLKHNGFSLGPTGIDGKMGNYTNAALKQWQTQNKMPADGLLNQPTLQLLSTYIPGFLQLVAEYLPKQASLKDCGNVSHNRRLQAFVI